MLKVPPSLPSPRYTRSRSRSYSPYRGGYSPRYNRRYRSRSPPRGRDQAGTRVSAGQHSSSVLLMSLSLCLSVCVCMCVCACVCACVLVVVLCVNTELLPIAMTYSTLSPPPPLLVEPRPQQGAGCVWSESVHVGEGDPGLVLQVWGCGACASDP